MSVKKSILIVMLIMTAIIFAYAAVDQMMSVTVRETKVRQTPSFLGKIVATLAYGDRVEVIEEGRGWVKIVLPDGKMQGWVNLSAMTEKRIVLEAGEEDLEAAASSSEVALAGKGFNSDVEEKFKKEKKLDYTWIDLMEKIAFPTDKLLDFLKKGGLTIQEGASK